MAAVKLSKIIAPSFAAVHQDIKEHGDVYKRQPLAHGLFLPAAKQWGFFLGSQHPGFIRLSAGPLLIGVVYQRVVFVQGALAGDPGQHLHHLGLFQIVLHQVSGPGLLDGIILRQIGQEQPHQLGYTGPKLGLQGTGFQLQEAVFVL